MFTTVASRNATPDPSTMATSTHRPCAVPKATCSPAGCRSSPRRAAGRRVRWTHATTPASRSAAIRSSSSPSSVARTSSVCSPSHGTRVSGPSCTSRHLDRVAGHEHRLLDPVGAGHLDEHVAGRDVRVVDHLLVAEARAGGDAGGARARRTTSTLVLSGGPPLDRRAQHVVEVVDPALAGRRSAGRSAHSGWPIELDQRGELVLAPDLDDEPAVVGAEAVHDQRRRARRCAGPSTRSW